MRRDRRGSIGIILTMLGLGLMLSFILPAKFLVVVLAIILSISGIVIIKI